MNIGVINLSKSPPKNDWEFRRSLKIFEEIFDAKVSIGQDFFSPIERSSPELRSRDINRFLCDQSIDIIWAYSGGAFANEVLPFIDFSHLSHSPSRPKIIAGFSDTTSLLIAASHYVNMESWHMPNFRTLLASSYGSSESLAYALARLRQRDLPYTLPFATNIFDYSSDSDVFPGSIVALPGAIVVHHGYAQGHIIAGNVSTMDLLTSTEFEPNWDGAILCIEECSELSLGGLRRILTAWRMRGIFDRISGVVWGCWQQGMMRDYESTLSNAWYTIEDIFDGYDFPVIGNALFGHISPNFPLILGRTLTIDTYARTLSIAGLSREMKDTHQS